MNDKKELLLWYEEHGRDNLPWRKTTDGYLVYLSEIMLQQTQVQRVKEHYYPQFIQRFPTLETLASGALDEVLALWSGLGYYTRANNLYKVAQICSKKGLPKSYDELIKLPGIGKYTASAICSFAYNQKIAVVDTNISRVLRRYFALTSEKHVWEKGFEFLNEHSPREHNLALMDLGALLCTPTKPKCEICPLYIGCKGAKAPHLYTKKKSVVYENIELHLGLFVKEGKIALIRSTEGLYKNLLTLPTTIPNEQMYISSFHHSYTRYKIKVNLYRLTTLPSQQEFTMIPLESISTAPISSLTKKALTNLS